MTKLKTLLEGFAWERKPGKPLPTLAEVQAEYEKNEAVSQSDADKRWNTDPIQMSMRKNTMPADSVLASSMSTPAKAPSNFYREKITALEAQRKQLEFDMEQEAEPEGGPIADYYGEALMHIDDQINAIRKKMSTNESIEEAQDKVSSRTHVVYACNVELADGSIKPGVRISVPKGNDAEKQVRDKIMARFGKDCKIRSIAKGQNPHNNDNDKDEPRWQDNDGDGKWYEPGDDVKENVNESFVSRLKKNFLGGATRK